MSDTRSDADILADMKAREAEWHAEDARVLAEHGGDEAAANKALGLENQAEKWNEEAVTNAALRDGTPARRVFDQVTAMDPLDRDAVYPPALTAEPD